MENITPISIEQEVRKSYLDYAMSVIVSRALPDVRDGLKPVQRRILYGMWRLNLKYGAKFAKSARIVGSILGYYHPHGDAPVYEALVRMAQDFSLRYPLIAGQGNFGCFTKDTKVKLTDGRNASFEELVTENIAGKKNYTYTVNALGNIAVAEIRNPRLTIQGAELVRVTLDNGEQIRCTPNHKFMLRSGEYREARDLRQGDSLMPLYERLSEKTDRLSHEEYILSSNGNHKVVNMEKLSECEDVYDLTIDGTHNFCLAAGVFVHNSIDGDSAAQMRYTEAKLAAISEGNLEEIDKETVTWKETFDGTRKEPEFLPAKLPNLLLNGAQGIAVGMATNIPPHNFTEIAKAIMHLLAHPNATLDELLQFVKGPDFPTGGIIYDSSAIKAAYATGRGAITMRAKIEIKEEKKGKYLVVSEIPYQVNKSDLITEIANLVRDGKIEGIQDIVDGSRKGGVNIVIELKRSAEASKVLNQLYHKTRLQRNFNVLTIALVDGIEPRLLSLPELLSSFISHRELIITRRTQFELNEAKKRTHILEGLALALSRIDEVIELIKKAKDRDEAKVSLQKVLELSEAQAEAILLMRLQTLAALERQAILDELEVRRALIKELESILGSPEKIRGIIKQELAEALKKFGDERKTVVHEEPLSEFRARDLIPREQVLIILTQKGYIKRVPPKTFQAQGRGGVGINGITLGEGDAVHRTLSAWTHDDLLFFSTDGKLYTMKAYEVPEKARTAKGDGLYEFFQSSASICEVVVLPGHTDGEEPRKIGEQFLVVISKKGLIKKVDLSLFGRIPKKGIKVIRIGEGDECLTALSASDKSELLALTAGGKSLRFTLKEIRAMGRQAAGVKGMRVAKEDELVELICATDPNDVIVLISENGSGKKVKVKSFSLHHRGGGGMKALRVTPKTGKLKIALRLDPLAENIFINSIQGKAININVKNIPLLGREAQGVKLIRLREDDKVASALLL